MSSGVEFRRAFNHALAMFIASCVTAVLWMCLRFPDASIMLVNFSFIGVSVLYDVKPFTERLRLICKMVFFISVLQFLIGMTWNAPLLRIILSASWSFFAMNSIKNKAAAGCVLLIGFLSLFSQSGFVPSVNRAAELIFAGGVVLAVTGAAGLVHVRAGVSVPPPGAFKKMRSVRIALTIAFSMFFIETLHFSQNAWIVLTAVFIAMAATEERSSVFFASIRLTAVPVGLVLGMLYMAVFTYFNANMMYLLPFIGAFGFFVNFYLKSYFGYTVFFMMAFSLYADLHTGVYKSFNILEITCERMVATLIGIILTIGFERYFLQETADSPKGAGQRC